MYQIFQTLDQVHRQGEGYIEKMFFAITDIHYIGKLSKTIWKYFQLDMFHQ